MAGPGETVDYAEGYSLDPSKDQSALREQAVRIASGADIAVVFVGPAEESEGFDRDHLDLLNLRWSSSWRSPRPPRAPWSCSRTATSSP